MLRRVVDKQQQRHHSVAYRLRPACSRDADESGRAAYAPRHSSVIRPSRSGKCYRQSIYARTGRRHIFWINIRDFPASHAYYFLVVRNAIRIHDSDVHGAGL